MGGSLAPVRVAGFRWNGWQPSAVYAYWINLHYYIILMFSVVRVIGSDYWQYDQMII
jgi:hypothetical protein